MEFLTILTVLAATVSAKEVDCLEMNGWEDWIAEPGYMVYECS
jgi:hypothetical protein